MGRHQTQDVTDLGLSADELRHGRRKVRGLYRHRGPDDGGAGTTDVARELIAAPNHGADEMTVCAEHLPQSRDLDLEVVLLDNPVRPDAAQ
jgi:hypothetical protein